MTRLIVLALLLCTFGVVGLGCQSADDSGGASVGGQTGRALAQIHCQRCHQFPEPDLLRRKLWEHAALPQMAHFMGLYEGGERPDSLFEGGAATRIVKQAGVYPEEPTLSRTQWRKIKDYYLSNAPRDLPPQPNHPTIKEGLERFQVRVPGDFRASPPLTSMVHVDAAHSRIWVGDVKADYSTLNLLSSPTGRLIDRIAPFQAPVRLRVSEDTLRLLDMGKFLPTDQPSGRLLALSREPGTGTYRNLRVLIDSLQRPVDFAFADLNGDGREDVVVCEFGRLTGRVSWFERKEGGGYRAHVLRDQPGAVKLHVRDLNGDGRPDVAVLMGQGDEGLYFFYNQGDGEFRQERILRFPPAYGSTHFELLDFNEDGHLDVLYTNGDNGDYYPLMRPYHGVRLFLGDSTETFEEAFFFPLNGAYRATAKDFDLDGDRDLAVISFYPDYEGSPEESFVYLENQGALRFDASTFAGSAAMGRWIVFDSGDLDGDGDLDLVLGSFVGFVDHRGYIPASLQRRWIRESPSLVVLENKTR